ncbi:MAG TPA: triose-phosphate isomerase [Lentisphaeria bacterium]|nr:MAG: triose-phosphate isomerase [Lentisphaerae bacterium GWF2_50_93]HCE43005.1 triose-phosphate isomerase [Lentisphaeria bacterium]
MKKRKLFIAGNWKMNKTATEAVQLVSALVKKVEGLSDKITMAVCPPFTTLDRISPLLKGSGVSLGAQNLSDKASGAYTGEISAAMLLDLGVKYVIIGHSERRQYYGETNELVSKKAKFALGAGLLPIVCIGETLQEREAGKMANVITTQFKGSLAGLTADDMLKTTIAYEPVWAIGTGKTASPDQAQEVHALIRKLLTDTFGQATADKVIVQYGGSVKADNAKELMAKPDIDGALVGGASLDAEGFASLIKNSIG